MPTTKAPAGETGYVNQVSPVMAAFSTSFGADWATFIRHAEETPVLKWPTSTRSFRLMMNDSQLQALYSMATLPILGYRYQVNPNGADEKIVQHVARDLGLPIAGVDDDIKRSAVLGFNFKRTMYHILKALVYGHAYFEIVGDILDDNLFHLRKLGYRPPESIMFIYTNRDGTLQSIRQRGLAADRSQITMEANRLASFVWDGEDGDFVGRSMLRSCYGDWLIKDRVKRDNAINIERGGGIPYVETAEGVTAPQMQALAQVAADFKVDEEGGLALPPGASLKVEKVSAPDAISTIRYHDESMARVFLAMFAMLGQTATGSRALGGTFVDFFGVGQASIANWALEGVDGVVRRLVEWNYGPQDSLPLVEYEAPDAQVAVDDIVALVKVGAIRVGPDTEAAIRRGINLPPPTAADEEATKPATATSSDQPLTDNGGPVAASGRHGHVHAATPDGQRFRRDLTPNEVAASFDPGKIADDHETAVTGLLALYQDTLKPDHAAKLTAAIESANGDRSKLAQLAVDAPAVETVASKLKKVYLAGHASHSSEAQAQGVDVGPADAALAGAEDRALGLVGLLSAGLSLSAGTKAIALTGQGLAPSEVATQVGTFLADLKDAPAAKTIQGAVTQAYNGGRFDAMRDALATTSGQVFASELLDENTCGPCAAIDGTDYDSLGAGEADYPSGGYGECEGGDYCRGTLAVEYQGA